jgi:hypothetical protein
MSLSPVLKWKDKIKKFGGFQGGTTALVEYHYYNPVGMTIRWHFSGVIFVSCADYDKTVHVDFQHALRKTVASFPNGIKLEVWIHNDTYTDGQGNTFDYAVFDTYFTQNDTIILQNTYHGHLDGLATGGVFNYTAENILKQYGLHFAMMTNYTGDAIQGQGGVIEGLSEAASLNVYMFVPCTDQQSIQSWVHITDDSEKYSAMYNDAQVPYGTAGLYQGGAGLANELFMPTILAFDDLATVSTDLGISQSDLFETGNDDDDPSTPTQEQDPSGTGGGGGNYDPSSDPVDFPTLPTGGAISSGAVKTFLVTTERVKSVFNVLWSTSLFDITTWQKIIEEPLDALISLQCIPALPTTGNGANIKLGNIDTTVIAPVVTSQYLTIDCGTLKVNEFWGSALDYSPYTKIEIFLPFIGIKELKAEDCMKQTLHVKYNMDILTGDLTCQIKCGQSVLYKFTGNCKMTVPVTSKVNNALEALVKGAATTATAGASSALAASGQKNATPDSIKNAGMQAAGFAAMSNAINVSMSKHIISRSGDLSGSVGMLDDFVPYLIIHRPRQSLAQNFRSFKGYPSNVTATLATLAGYTEIEYIHLENISGATDAELTEIENLLKAGVII